MNLRFLLSISLALAVGYAADSDAIIFADRPEFRADKTIVLSDGTQFHLDMRSREVASVLPDGEIRFAGGFGSGYGNFMEPVDIASDGVSLFVCDRTGNSIVQLNRRMEPVQILSVTHPGISNAIYPSSISVNELGYLAVLSEDHRIILTKQSQEDSWALMADLDRQLVPIQCPENVRFTSSHSIALTGPCSNREYTFSLFGRLLSARLTADGE